MTAITLLQAIHDGLAEEMTADERVILIGEDIASYGGAFKVTAGLLEQFGPDRVIDTPIAEAVVIGTAAGAAMCGLRPVAELQFIDFLSCAGFDQLVTVAAKSRYRNGVGCGLVLRGPAGGGVRGGPFHSGNPEMWCVTTPGIKVAYPSTAYDAKGLLKTAIRDPDPVLFLEHKHLYRRQKDEVPGGDYVVPFGEGAVRRAGDDLSIITYGALTHTALAAAERLAEQGQQARVIDLRTLVPLDEEIIARAAMETSRVIVLHEHARRGGMAGEVAAVINERAFDYLDAPIRRVTPPDTPVPYAPTLEDAYLPQVDDVLRAAEDVLKY
ncbi:MAG: alpha-ketoacid dehydrogenase subunit beta [Deltaproteobacteria bacterium]|nr:alpha-ketoacid dehydrogenase subunit beta [Deltaproteobacteria bacterium]